LSTVFITQVPHRLNRETGELEPLDMSAAREWGDPRVILTPGANPFTSMPAIVDDLHASLKDIGDQDYLILVGNPAIMGVAACIAAQYLKGKLRVLQWSGKAQRYNLIEANAN
jgi:hypothetical protein